MRILILFLICCLALPVCGAESKPNKGANKKAPNPTIYDAVRIWDKDNNNQIEGAEAEPLRAAVAVSSGGVIKSLDTDDDGKLSDAELDAMNAALKPQGSAGKSEAGHFDRDANGQINGTEVREIQDAFKHGAKLGGYDLNHDGELSDAEIAKIRTGNKEERAVQPGKVFIAPKRKGHKKR